jgi:hypothetical protein
MNRDDGNRNSNLYWIIGALVFLAIFAFQGLLIRVLVLAVFLFVATTIARLIVRATGLRTGMKAIDDFIETGHVTTPFQPKETVAAEAMRCAGYDPNEGGLQLDDIGLLVYHGKDSEPKIYRTSDVPTDALYVRPFVMLRHSWSANTTVTIRFDLLDDNWKLVYTSDNLYSLQYHQNFITPKTWLPLHDQESPDVWSLEVFVENRLIGVHDFEWLQIGGEVRTLFNGEGELDAQSSRLADTDRPLTVDELLEEQGGELSAQIG